MQKNKLLIANRGEIAIRIIQAASDLGIPTVSIFSEDDTSALHRIKSDESYPLKGKGRQAYLDIAQIIDIAHRTNCNLIHPGYGFLSEDADFAQQCIAANIIFVGPKPATLSLFGNKIKARQLALSEGIPIIPGISETVSIDEIKAFFQTLNTGDRLMIKAISGGGGKGMRIINKLDEIETAYQRCVSEAQKSFGNDKVYVEKYLPIAQHIEVQIIGDGKEVAHLWERACSIQRSHQKIVEIAPCPGIAEGLRDRLVHAALQLAKVVNYKGVGTFEFLVEGTKLSADAPFYFLEMNPRIQVEHTVTEEITGIDLVQFQIQAALGFSLEDLNLKQFAILSPQGYAIQARINAESIDPSGNTLMKLGLLKTFQMPFGKGIRLETAMYEGYQNSPHYDNLLAKLIVHSKSNDFKYALTKMYRALCECQILGIEHNLSFLQNILQHPALASNQVHTRFLEENIATLSIQNQTHKTLFFQEKKENQQKIIEEDIPVGIEVIRAIMPGSVISITAKEGDYIKQGQALMLIEAMKMESVIMAEMEGIIQAIKVAAGDVIFERQVLFYIKKTEDTGLTATPTKEIDLDYIRPELAELYERKALHLDENRSKSVAKRKQKGKQTARENIAQLCATDSFWEYGSMIVAAQRGRRSIKDLIENTPADGIITGIGAVNSHLFDESISKCMILCYDYMIMSGTQGMFGHHKTDRVLEVAHRSKLPIILFAEGGGGRPGDVDFQGVGGLHVKTFAMFAKLNGLVPRIAIVSGYCFAGNAALAGCADVIIATEDTSIGMGGPAMIEGGGLGKYHPKEVGPATMQAQNGVLDILVKDENTAIETAKKYLTYFQGAVKDWTCEDQRKLRHIIPENRRRIYDIRQVIQILADKDSVLELRKDYAIGIITAFIRIEGKPMGLIANNPVHLGGAIDAGGSDKAARFLQLCNVFGIPILSLCDTPGFMVGPEAEKTALVRHTARLFTIGAKIQVPFFTVVLRKAYGLGSMGMAAGGMHEPLFTVSWPTGEFGGMGLEGAIRLGYRKELAAIEDPVKREALFQKMLTKAYEHGKALNTASYFEIDEVIDPADTRKAVVTGLLANTKEKYQMKEGRDFVDTW